MTDASSKVRLAAAIDAGQLLEQFLQATPDHVYFKDCDSRFIRVSAAQAKWLGLSCPEEALGRSDADFFGEEHARQALDDEQRIVSTGEPLLNVEEKETWDDGTETWVSTSKMPLLDSTGSIVGTFGISRDVTARRIAEARLTEQSALNEYQSLHDALTGLPNRRLYHDRVDHAIRASARDGGKMAVLLVDLDRFKEINDMLGHHAGDELLRQVSKRLSAALRASDTVARLGGDEFGLMIPKLGHASDARQLAEKICESIEQPIILEGLPVSVEASVGVALYPSDGDDAPKLIQRADVAMYAAKRENKGHMFYDASLDTYDPARLTLVGELRRAMDDRELVLFYQPKEELVSGRVESVEALLRWNHPSKGLVMPDEFIPHAQETGLMRPLTLYVIQEAAAQCRRWLDDDLEIAISVNIATRNLLDTEFPERVAELIEAAEVKPSLIQLEITEGMMLEDPFRAKVALEKLSAIGVGLAIDDFGTGYSSLAYLKNLPVDEIKIDRSFVIGMDDDVDDEIIVKSSIDLARNLGFKVTAEGVENGEVLAKLRELHCDTVQGFFLSRPIPADELTVWLRGGASAPAAHAA